MTKILILLSLTTFGCSHTPPHWHCNGDPVVIHVCPAEGHGPCPFCKEVEQ